MGVIHHRFTVGSLETQDLALGSAISWLGGYGIGGVYIGYKQAGVKGAVVGGVAGVAGAIGSAMGVGLVAGLVGVAITGPVLLVAGVAVAAASVFSSKFALDKFLSRDAVPKFRESFVEAVRGQINDLRKGGDFVEQVRSQVFTAYEQLKESVERDTETVLRDTEQTLATIKDQLMTDKVSTEHEKERLKTIAAECREVLVEAERLQNMLVEIDEKE
jgi:hypothetical protein